MSAAKKAKTEASDNVYTPKNILITGGAGFIASHVAIRLCNNHPEYKASTSMVLLAID